MDCVPPLHIVRFGPFRLSPLAIPLEFVLLFAHPSLLLTSFSYIPFVPYIVPLF